MPTDISTMNVRPSDKQRLDVVRAVEFAGSTNPTYSDLLGVALDTWAEQRGIDFDEFLEKAGVE